MKSQLPITADKRLCYAQIAFGNSQIRETLSAIANIKKVRGIIMINKNSFFLSILGIFFLFLLSSCSKNTENSHKLLMQENMGMIKEIQKGKEFFQTHIDISKNEILTKIIPIVDREYFLIAKKIIQEAEKSVSISMFVVKSGIKVDTLIKELKNAANRGVKIRILLEDNIRANQSVINSLNGINNIEIKFDSPQKTTHNKMIIIDENVILIGSTNWTESSLSYANEANVVINNREIAEYFQAYFNYLWKDSSKDISPFKDFKGEIIPIIDRQYFDIVNRMMRKATKRIFVMVYGFKLTWSGDSKGDILAEKIVNAKKRGVETKVLLEKSDFNERLNNMNNETIEYFKESGIASRFDDEDIITHSKVVIIDDAVIMGATNWSYSGLELWHNTDILIREKGIVEYFVDYFEEKFGNGR
jgi:phosphatidylserine/phosphatidylglycerophosphate/cardiolipin synthase-like enzyme